MKELNSTLKLANKFFLKENFTDALSLYEELTAEDSFYKSLLKINIEITRNKIIKNNHVEKNDGNIQRLHN